MNNVVEPRIEKFGGPLVIGGTPVDDAIMDLVAISELAADDPRAARVMESLVELISAELAGLKKSATGGDCRECGERVDHLKAGGLCEVCWSER